jgi:hypothetical protein
MTLGASLSKSLSSFTTARHVFICFVCLLTCAWRRVVCRLLSACLLVTCESNDKDPENEPLYQGA